MAKFFWNYLRIKPHRLPERLSPIEEMLKAQEDTLWRQFEVLENSNGKPMNFLIFGEPESIYCFPQKDKEVLLDPLRREKFLMQGVAPTDLPSPHHCVEPLESIGKDGEPLYCEYTGSITYHGPGQLVCYLVVNMTELGFSGIELAKMSKIIDDAVKDFLRAHSITSFRLLELFRNCDPEIEQSLLAQGAIWRNEQGEKQMAHEASGLWVVQNNFAKKIMSRALAKVPYYFESDGEKKHCYFLCFGFALNINTDLSYFAHIHPCGLPLEITSIAEVSGGETKIRLPKAAEVLAELFVKKVRSATGDDSHELI